VLVGVIGLVIVIGSVNVLPLKKSIKQKDFNEK
jgi:hypothetical protein